ncbi:UNVERIFIED_CONTAM: hypothetical protein Sradi_1570800 [Sesamum radiatum]|uniref:Reverse transcriptase RNase H-like domain-containing protein n=1 Tax=Sesamum radiatum TaxID=300843 RepID=A0AAW2U8L7_SESRA
MQAALVYEREIYAITEAVRRWRYYLLGRKFFIITDHQSLKGLLTQTIQTPAQYCWLTKLLGYDYEILYTLGKANVVADALSRHSAASLCLFVGLTVNTPSIIAALRQFFSSHPAGISLRRHLQHTTSSALHFSEQHGLVFYHTRLFVPEQMDLRQSLISEFHSSAVGGHSGARATMARLAASFY